MKKKERVHLKEDPFQQFIQKTLSFLKEYRKLIFVGIGAVVLAVIIIIGMIFIRSLSVKSENLLYTEALNIKNNDGLDIDQKIEKLSQMDSKSGISASVKLILASLYFEKGELEKSREILGKLSKNRYKLINDQKKLLEANILIASNKNHEALELLNQLVSAPQTEIAKDFVLLTMARIQMRTDQVQPAIANLKRIVEEYPGSYYSYEASNLLKGLEGE